MNPFTLLRLLAHPEFQEGALVGVVGAIVLLLVRPIGWLPTWGVAAVAALAWTGRLGSGPGSASWALAVTAVVTIVASWAVGVLLRKAPGWSIGFAFALWVLGVWGTVPDTERAVVTMGVTAAMLPLLWPTLGVPIRAWGALVAVPTLGFVTATDGAARTSAIAGSFGMAGMMVVAAAALAARRESRVSAGALIAAQVVHVIVSGRLAGQAATPATAVLIAAASALVTGGALALTQRGGRAPRRGSEPGPPGAHPRISGRSASRTPLLTGFERPRRKR